MIDTATVFAISLGIPMTIMGTFILLITLNDIRKK